METNSGWLATDVRHQSPFRLCWSFWLILANIRPSVSQQPSSLQIHLPLVYTSHAESRRPVGRLLPNHTGLGCLQFFRLPWQTLKLKRNFFSVSHPKAAALVAHRTTKQPFMCVISIRASPSHYLHYHPSLFRC